ncbi:hypothetical protein M413DRAFT_32431 [Hebeloma cylindrosporum]|uniref:EthD domain-containing protein n=1 Tax=Hebeloma cylindrosporum TaxID=76867 RepID=A0A0C3BFM0_HEBCY|nr:hypothetical protein M413DRAFT_32431 [Hebeloma cylindrosporum h7]
MSIRVTCLIKRRPDLTHEQFSEHWGKKHAEIFTSLKAVKTNIVRYNQFHVLEPQSKASAAAGLPIADFDGAAEFWVESLQDLFALFGDEEYLKKAVPDEANFLDRSSVQILVGEDQTKWVKK